MATSRPTPGSPQGQPRSARNSVATGPSVAASGAVASLNASERIACLLVHDLCQPLTAIAAEAAAARRNLEKRGGDEALGRAVEIIAAQADEAVDITRDILAFITRGEANRRLHDVSALVREIVEDARKRTAANGIALRAHAPGGHHAVIDAFLIGRAVRNLIENAAQAVTAAERSHPCIETRVVARAGSVSIVVADNGPGFAEATAQGATNAGDRSSAHGFGLTLCRAIAEAHGGLLGIEPRDHGGTIAWITLPTDR